MASFADHFSGHATEYARARPRYPAQLFEALAALAPGTALAWDAGTGNGQAAIGLADHFDQVIATDPSPPQLANAAIHPRVRYRLGTADQSGLADGRCDLVCAAQAAHWFDLPGFYAEAARVVRPGGVVSLWCYGRGRVSGPVDEVLDHFHTEVVGPYWPPQRHHVDSGYRDLAFPFPEVPFPGGEMRCHWSLQELLDYLATWSAVQRYRARHGRDPLDLIRGPLAAAWGDPAMARTVTWPLSGRAGRKGSREQA